MKQSDHRPVVSVIDISVDCINLKRRDNVFKEVITDLGPHDSTIVIKAKKIPHQSNASFDDTFMEKIIHFLSEFGEIALVRFVDDSVRITFKNGISALAAAEKKIIEVDEHQIEISLLSPNWTLCSEKEIGIFEETESSFEDQNLLVIKNELKNLSVNTDDHLRSKSPPPPRPVPPTKYFESAAATEINSTSSKLKINETKSSLCSLETAQVVSSTNKFDLTSKTLENTNLPSLPSRLLSPLPAKVSASIVQTELPPPVPSRSSVGPPIPKKN